MDAVGSVPNSLTETAALLSPATTSKDCAATWGPEETLREACVEVREVKEKHNL